MRECVCVCGLLVEETKNRIRQLSDCVCAFKCAVCFGFLLLLRALIMCANNLGVAQSNLSNAYVR